MLSTGYVLRRVGQALVVMLIVYSLTFFALFVLPGDPIENKIANPVNPLPAVVITATCPLVSSSWTCRKRNRSARIVAGR